jgi:phospholipase/carboxylesterase
MGSGPGAPEFVHRYLRGPRPLTVLALHGTGGTEADLLPLAAQLAPGASVLSPRGRVSEGGAARFFRRSAPGVFDLDDLRAQAADLARFVGAVTGTGPVLALGYSNGANMAAALLLLHPGTLAGAVLLRPMVPLVPEPLPDLAAAPVWLACGRFDPVVPETEPRRLADVLRRAGADVSLRWADADHRFTRPEIRDAAAWVAERFPG